MKDDNEEITINGQTLKEWLESRQDKNVQDMINKETNMPIYRKSKLKVERKRQGADERASRARYLTEEEILREYGMEAKAMSSRADQVLWVLKNQLDNQGKTLKQMFQDNNTEFLAASHTSVMPRIWAKLHNTGLIDRFYQGKKYYYFKTDKFKDQTFDDLKKIMRQQVKTPPKTPTQETGPVPATGEKTPKDINVKTDVNIKIEIRFGLLKE